MVKRENRHRRIIGLANGSIKNAGAQIKNAQGQIEHDLRSGERNAEGVDDDQSRENPEQIALESAGEDGEAGEQQSSEQARDEHQPLHQAGWDAAEYKGYGGKRIEDHVQDKKPL